METENMQIEYVEIGLLKPYPGNPRDFDEKGKSDLKRSLKKFGWTSPLLINMANGREYVVLSGNMRLECALEMKQKQVPCVKVIIDSLEKEREILLRMNVLNGNWNIELLRDFDIETVLEAGFKEFDLAGIWDESLNTEEDDFDVEAELEKIKTPKTKFGEIYVLGNHVLGCGDSTDHEFVEKVMGGTKVDMVYSDPKFNLSLSYDRGIGGKSSYGGKIDDNMSEDDYREFLRKSMKSGLAVAKPDCHVFFYNDQRNIGLTQDLYRELGISNKRVCLWIKNGLNPTPQIAFNKCFEACMYGTIGKPYLSPKCPNLTEILNKEIATGNRQFDDILDSIDLWLAKRLAGQEYTHPTEKPITLHEKPLRRCTKPGDVVLDLFCGSSSTLISCQMLKRRCYTIDIDPVFCDLAIARFKALTGQEPKLISGDQDGK